MTWRTSLEIYRGEVETIERENNDEEVFKIVNFPVVSKDDEGNKTYANCLAYGDKGDILKDFKQGNFIKLFQSGKNILMLESYHLSF